MSETFIKIDSLQHLEISRQTYPTNRSKMCVTTFTVFGALHIAGDANRCIRQYPQSTKRRKSISKP